MNMMTVTSHVAPQPRSPLLSLPAELRTQVYTHLLQTQLPTPKPSSQHPPHSRDFVIWPSDPARMLVNSDENTHNLLYLSSGLALACRQTSREIYDLVNRNKGLFAYHLDLHIVSDAHCYPTWLCLPAPPHWYYKQPTLDLANLSDQVESDLDIDVDLRLPGTDPEATSDEWTLTPAINLRWGGDGGPGEAQIMLLTVLGHWCVQGPTFMRALPPASLLWRDGIQAETGNAIKTRTLRMHFMSCNRKAPVTPQGIEAFLGESARQEINRQLRNRFPQLEHWYSLKWELERLATCGLLYGRFQKLRLDVTGSDFEEEYLAWNVSDRPADEKRSVAKSWAGFGWLPGK